MEQLDFVAAAVSTGGSGDEHEKGMVMRTKLIALLTMGGLAFTLAANAGPSGATVTITGDGACAKCQLKQGKACEATVTAVEGGKKVTYYLRENDASKEISKQLCSDRKQLKVSGTVQTVDGRFELTPTRVEIVKPPI